MTIAHFIKTIRRGSAAALLSLLLSSGIHAADHRVLLIAGSPSHGPGWHEYNAGMLLLQKCLAGTPDLMVDVSLNGWPAAPGAFDGVDAIVLFCDGGPGHPALRGDHLAQLNAAVAKGAGLGLLHYALEPAATAGEAEFLRGAGGCFEANWSVNPIWTADFPRLPDHPILRGVQPFTLRDEWYYHLRFAEDMKGVTPLLVAVPPPESLERPDGPHEGNAAVRAAVARREPQCLAWAYERPGGGRGFGFAGLHYQSDWENDNVRKLLLNSVMWLAKMEVPAEGVSSRVSEVELWDHLDAKPASTPAQLRGSANRVRTELAELEAEIASARAAAIDTSAADISALTVRRFLDWIGWDIAHPADLVRLTSRCDTADVKRLAPKLAAQIPGQEIADCLAVLDRSRIDLAGLRNAPTTPPLSPVASAGSLVRVGSYFTSGGRPVFIGGLTHSPRESDVYGAYGPITSFQITPASLAGEGEGMSTDALRQLERSRDETEKGGGRFDVFLGHSPPAWAVRSHPEITAASRQFVKYDIDHPLVRDFWRRLLAEAVPVLRGSPAALHTYMLSNEPTWYTTQGVWSTGSVSEYTFANFRAWLARRYGGGISELNRRWGTGFASFAAVRIDLPLDAKIKGSPLWYDWCRFNMDRVTAWFTFLRDEIRKSDPAALCHIKLVTDYWLTTRHEKDNGLDYETLASEVEDLTGADTAAEPPYALRRFDPIAPWSDRYALGWQEQSMYYDFLKSVAPDKPIFDSEFHAFSAGSWRVPHVAADYVRTVLWLGHLHGLAVNQTWYWPRQEDGGIEASAAEAFYGSLAMQPLALDAYGRAMRELNAHAPEIVALAQAPRPIRIFYSTDSAIQSSTFLRTIAKAYEAAYFSGSAVGFVTERILAAAGPAELRSYPLLLVPSATHVTDGAVAQLRRYAAGGGTVVLFGPASLERNVYGDERPKSELAFLDTAPRIDAEAEVEMIGRQVASLATRAGIRPLVECRGLDGQLPWGVRCVSVATERGCLVNLVNLSRSARTITLQTSAGPIGTPENLLSRHPLGGLSLTLRPMELRLLSISPP